MSPQLQTRLLRVLAEGEFYRVGGQLPVKVDVRVIAATHQDLEARVKEGLFREDLLHRLNVIRIGVPPLRNRREDIPELLQHYLDVAAMELGVAPKILTEEAERGARRLRLARQRAPARQRLPPPHGARGRARDRARRHSRRTWAADPRRPHPSLDWSQRARELGAGRVSRPAARRCSRTRCPSSSAR